MRGGVMTLEELQDSFQQALLAGGDGVLTQLADGPREPKEALLGLYRDSYILAPDRVRAEGSRASFSLSRR